MGAGDRDLSVVRGDHRVRQEGMATLKIVGMDDVYPATIADVVDSITRKLGKITRSPAQGACRACGTTLVVLPE